MGDVVGLIQIMPTDVLEDEQLNQMIEEIKQYVKPPAKVGNIEIKNIAFGLRGINLTVVIPDSAGTGGRIWLGRCGQTLPRAPPPFSRAGTFRKSPLPSLGT